MEDEPIKDIETLIDKVKKWNIVRIKHIMKIKEYENPRLSFYHLSDTRPRCPNCEMPLEYIKDTVTLKGKMYYCEKCKKKLIIT